MNESEAQQWIERRFGRTKCDALQCYVELLVEGSREQNLIARSTWPEIWVRHIVDSAQLIRFAPPEGAWLDIGSGAGLPGLVIAILTDRPVILCEPRAKRVAFLEMVTELLSVSDRVTMCGSKVDVLDFASPPTVISARAVASLDRLFAAASHLANDETVWVLPRGSHAESEVADARLLWQGTFHVERSVTDPRSGIAIARGVRRR